MTRRQWAEQAMREHPPESPGYELARLDLAARPVILRRLTGAP